MLRLLIASMVLVSGPASALEIAEGALARGVPEAPIPSVVLAPSAISLSPATSLPTTIAPSALSAAPSLTAPAAVPAAGIQAAVSAAPDPAIAQILSKLDSVPSYQLDDARREYGDALARRAVAAIKMARMTGYIYERSFGPAWQKPKLEGILSAAAELIGIPGYDLDRACAAYQKFLNAEDLKGTPGYLTQMSARRNLPVGEAAAEILRAGAAPAGPDASRPWIKPTPYSPYAELLVAHSMKKDLLLSMLPKGMPVQFLTSGYVSPQVGSEPNMYLSWVRDYHRLLRFVPRRGPDGTIVHEPQQIEYVYPFSPNGRPIQSVDSQSAPNAPAPEVRKFAGILRGGNTIWTAGTTDQPGYFITSDHTTRFSGMTHDELRDYVNNSRALDPRTAEMAQRVSGETWVRQFEDYIGIGPDAVGRNHDQVVAALADAARVPADHVIVAPWMPGSQTGDVDEYAADLGGNAVAVAELMPEDIESRSLGHERDYARNLGQWLDARARDFAARGLTVERVPMFAPVNLKPNEYGGWNPDILATVGWAVANLLYIVPDYSAYLIAHGHAPASVLALQKRIEQRTREMLERYGITGIFTDASAMVGSKGSIHCLTGAACAVAPK